MAFPVANTVIKVGKSGRAQVLVGGVPLAGCIGVELIQPTIESRGPDGTVRIEKEGTPVWHIRVSSRFVNCQPSDVD